MVPDMDVTAPATLTASALADAVAATAATLVFASPAALTNVARTADELRGDQRAALGGVRTLLSAGRRCRRRCCAGSPRWSPVLGAHTPYGMTECLPVADIDLATIEAVGPGNGVCVGHPVPGVEVAISPLDADGAATGALTREPGSPARSASRRPTSRTATTGSRSPSSPAPAIPAGTAPGTSATSMPTAGSGSRAASRT
jgi:olefin beta-lactone synthetase